MITLNNVSLARGTKPLFSNVSLSFYHKQKIGIVGKNGSGKTSLFLLLQEMIEPNDGYITPTHSLQIVSIAQDIPRSHRMASEYVMDADKKLRTYQQALVIAEKNQDATEIAQLYERLRSIDGFTAEKRANKILMGLGFSQIERQTPVNQLSGGWRMRLNIARALFAPSTVLLLDEPTNHLDLDATIWLEQWLTHYSGLLLFISHDREFLDNVATHIVSIAHQQIKIYNGNYTNFEKQRIAQLAVQQLAYEKQKKEIDRIQTFIQRFKAKASKAKQAQSRIKALKRLKEIIPAHIDSPFSFEFPPMTQASNPLLSLNNVSFSYNESPILKHVQFQLRTEDRIALLGKNGAGKSTFIKLLAQELSPTTGKITQAPKLNVEYFAQHTLDRLNVAQSPLAHLQAIAPTASLSSLRNFLGGFNFSGDISLMPVRQLSGGEKARLSLALIVSKAPHVLLLDEPTNHLDLDMRQALMIALQHYEGAVVLVSHDRFLLEQATDQYWLVKDQQLQPFTGGLDAYQHYLLQRDNIEKPTVKTQKNNRKKLSSIERRLEKIQKEISQLDEMLSELSLTPIQNKEKLNTLADKRIQLLRQRETYEDEWLQLA
jgi:ATP-binding cassette subfamily F protein 3